MKHILAGMFTVAMALPAYAQSVKLTATEITDLLTGNTAIGLWDGIAYRQYFGDDGVTLFAQDGAWTARGVWRTDTEVDEFQSIWPGDADWEGWFIMEYLGDYYWVSRSTPPTPFEVVDGQQLLAEIEG